MDTTDPNIVFDDNGVCDHCHGFQNDIAPNWHPDATSRTELARIFDAIKEKGKGKEFDCILGMSGGLDSSYMLHQVVSKFGLRPLVFHVDGGWNSDIAVNNIQMLVDGLGLDLYTEVINWEEMRDFQLSFFKSGVSHLDIPQDHAFVATLYRFADKYNIKYIMNGGNFSTECVRNPLDWLYHGSDLPQIKDIQKRFGTRELKTYPFSPILYHKVYLRYLRGVKVLKPLNYLPYSKQIAIDTLSEKYGWKVYPQKHFESRFTKFFEAYWLPTRFGYDTRKVQYSSLILTDQMTRAEAMDALAKPAYDPETIDEDFEYIATKLGISVEELRKYHELPLKTHRDYRNQEKLFSLGSRVMKAVGLERSVKR
jgi:N-acetyl sugar amidotransferase